MSVLLIKILWYQLTDIKESPLTDNKYANPTNITDSIVANAAKALDIQNNILTVTVRNPHSNYVNTLNKLVFQEQDQIKLWLKYTDDPNDISSGKWNTNTITEPEEAYLVGTYYLVEVSGQHSPMGTLIQIKCADKTYILFNKVLAKAFLKSDNLSVPKIIQKVIRLSSQTDRTEAFIGSGTDSGVKYDIDARLDSERTPAEEAAGIRLIADVRRNETEQSGILNSDTAFPTREIAKVWKPIYEWIGDLSQPERTNTDAELAGTSGVPLVYGRPFIFWVDEQNRFRWIYPTDIIANYIEIGKFTDETLSYDSTKTNTADVFNVSLNLKVFDVTNMIIFNAGDDMNGVGTWGYVIDTTSNVKTLKMRVVPMVDIAEKYKGLDYEKGIPQASRKGTPAGLPRYQYPLDARYADYGIGVYTNFFVPTTTFATSSTINNDNNYNDALREKITFEGESRAGNLMKGLSHARWKGSLTTKGANYSVGNLLEYTDISMGLYKQKLRIMEVRHNVSTSSWTTELELEEDAKAVLLSGKVNT